jgi:hypothetical protein
LVHKNVMGKVPIVGRNNRLFTHCVLLHQKNRDGCLLLPLLLSLVIVVAPAVLGFAFTTLS